MGMEEGMAEASARSTPSSPKEVCRHDRETRHATTISTHTLDVPGATMTYDIRRDERPTTSRRSCSSARPWAPPASAPWPATSPTGRSSPTTRAASSAASRPIRRPVHARPTPTTCTGSSRPSAAGPVDLFAQQRRRGQRARPGRAPPGGRAYPRRPRAAAGGDRARPRGGAGGVAGHHATLPAARLGRRAWRTSSPSSATTAPFTAD